MPIKTTIDGREIELKEKPSHKAVKNVQNFMTGIISRQLDIDQIQQAGSLEDAIRSEMTRNPEILQEVSDREATLEFDQTIMLATGWTLSEFLDFEENATEEGYWSLYDKCVEVMGQNAEGFFERYDSSSFSRAKRAKMATMMSQQRNPGDSEVPTSTNQPENS